MLLAVLGKDSQDDRLLVGDGGPAVTEVRPQGLGRLVELAQCDLVIATCKLDPEIMVDGPVEDRARVLPDPGLSLGQGQGRISSALHSPDHFERHASTSSSSCRKTASASLPQMAIEPARRHCFSRSSWIWVGNRPGILTSISKWRPSAHPYRSGSPTMWEWAVADRTRTIHPRAWISLTMRLRIVVSTARRALPPPRSGPASFLLGMTGPAQGDGHDLP